MALKDNLQTLRKVRGLSQEELADKLKIARQTVSKWETGQAVPELCALVSMSELFGVPIDRIVKDACNLQSLTEGHGYADVNADALAGFLVLAKRNTYAAKADEIKSSRTKSHDFFYANEDAGYKYLDSYFGGEHFAGEEIVWLHDIPVWAMNYAGRVTGENFSGDFLKEALLAVPAESPFRGPPLFIKGEYCYHCDTDGTPAWFSGNEAIFYRGSKIYECKFHGGFLN